MSTTKHVYKNPVAGTPLLSTICSGCRTPWLQVKFCTLVKPFYYENSKHIPRYSITCAIDPEEHGDFLKSIQTIEKNEKVDSVLKSEFGKDAEGQIVMSGRLTIKFQSKEKIPIYMAVANGEPEPMTLEDELAAGSKVLVIYDIVRYTKKNPTNTDYGLSFKATSIFYFPEQK